MQFFLKIGRHMTCTKYCSSNETKKKKKRQLLVFINLKQRNSLTSSNLKRRNPLTLTYFFTGHVYSI